MAPLYEDDLAFVHASGFGDLSAAAVAVVIPELRCRAARRVLDIGCGAGVSTKALVDAGFETLGIEPSEPLLALARHQAPSATFLGESVYDVPLPQCDAILAFGEALSYHAPEHDAEARIEVLIDRASRALRHDGLLVFDLVVSGAPSLSARAWRAGPDWAVLSVSHEDAAAPRLTREIETFRDMGGGLYRRRREVHHVYLFEQSRIVSRLERAGFEVRVAQSYGEYPLAPRRVAFFASRRR